MRYGFDKALRKAMLAIVFFAWAATALADQFKLAALGDSLTQGYGLAQEDGFVPQLQSWLREQGADVTVINAGVSGDTTAGGAARVGWTLTPDTDAMIVALGGNDLLRGIDPATSRANLSAILETARQAGVPVLLIGMKAPGNYGRDYQQAFDAIYPELAEEFGVLLVDNFFAGILGEENDPAAMRPFLQADGIHPNTEGVGRIVADLGPRVLELLKSVAPDA